jgi:quinate dehydrogenase (quinone)
MNWGSVSVDPTSSYMFVNDMRLGLANYMIPRANIKPDGQRHRDGRGAARRHALRRDARALPVAAGHSVPAPPFGTMSAIDLKTRKLVWQVPVGTVKDTGPLGIRMGLPIPIGMPTLGASLATQSGLLFFAGTQDFYLRAFDTAAARRSGRPVCRWAASRGR